MKKIVDKIPALEKLEDKYTVMKDMTPELKELNKDLDSITDMSDMATAREGGKLIKRILDQGTAKQDIAWAPYMPSHNPYMRAYDPFSLPRNITTVFPKVVMEPRVIVPGYNITNYGYYGNNGTYGNGYVNGTRVNYQNK